MTAPHHAQVEQGITGTCVVMVTPDSRNVLCTLFRDYRRIKSQELDLDALNKARYLYIEGYLATSPSARHAVASARALAKAQNIKTHSPFPTLRWCSMRDGLTEMLEDGVDILFCNEHEAKLWANTDDLAQAISNLHQLSPLLAVTCGSKGAIISNKGQQITIASFQSLR